MNSALPAAGREAGDLVVVSGYVRTETGRSSGTLAGLTLGSHFQPVYSLAHRRTVGFEAFRRDHGADYAQGYLFAKPAAVPPLPKTLAAAYAAALNTCIGGVRNTPAVPSTPAMVTPIAPAPRPTTHTMGSMS
jgi:hypothetical protein